MKQLFTSIFAGLFLSMYAGAQAPNISYIPANYVLQKGTTITPITPNNTGGVPLSTIGNVSAWVGSPNSFGSIDDTGTSASFRGVAGIARDASGNIYVAEYTGNRIRVIDPSGVVTTLAGGGGTGVYQAGYADGTGNSAAFNNPTDVAVDNSGNVFVADMSNHRIRKITPSGVVSTIAGNGTPGYVDGIGTAALLGYPYGIAVNDSGYIFFSDLGSNTIRKISPAGVVTTFAGNGNAGYADGSGTAASFNNPRGLCFDNGGNLFVADRNNCKIRKISPSGIVTTVAGSAQGYADGLATVAMFQAPEDVAVDVSGDVYVPDILIHRI